jgi:hypothetical protein
MTIGYTAVSNQAQIMTGVPDATIVRSIREHDPDGLGSEVK